MIEDKDGISWENVESYLFTGILRGCGCGHSDEIAKDVLETFLAIAGDDFNYKYDLINKDLYHELIANWFMALDLTEHGSSIQGSWLTGKGKEVLEELNRLKRLPND